MIKIGFITGARSEYGVMKNLIQTLASDDDYQVSIITTGMHYMRKYGNTIEMVKKDAYAPIIETPCINEEDDDSKSYFVDLLNVLYKSLSQYSFDVVYIIGDRLEAYAAALSAHFLKIPIAHFAGGQLTNGAVDNIYRYNISNLATIHFVTNIFAYNRLQQIPIIDKEKVYMVGSSAIDSINEYLKYPQDAFVIDSKLRRGNYVLMTYHSETNGKLSKNTIVEVMDASIKQIIDSGLYLLITYPNNDSGSDAIINIIEKWEKNSNVVVRQNLGAEQYYIAVDNAQFVIGNSSSGIIEVPYFQKYTVDVGDRQTGRSRPQSVLHVDNDCNQMYSLLSKVIESPDCKYSQEYIYGKGGSIQLIQQIIKKEINHE